MKFVCVPCDQPMKLTEVGPPDRGSLAVRFACPACGYEMAMLTNPYETQLVSSLGVRIGSEAEHAPAGLNPAEPSTGQPTESSGCPFPAMVAQASGAGPDAGRSGSGGVENPETTAPALYWTPEAEARLVNIPVFVRPMARAGIERFARERGCERVDEVLLDEARAFFGM
jgi:hypothetical protein